MSQEEAIAATLQWLQDKVESVEGFVAREAPALANEIVAWYFWSSIVGLCLVIAIGVPLLVAGFLLLRRCGRMAKHEDWEGYGASGVICATMGGLVIVLAGGLNLESAIKAKVAPRVVVLEHITGSVHK